MQVIATAGHVDHGKSALVRALTGTDPDRLAEEKKRGMTLDLGFAWTRLPSGAVVSFVDVPGHERFVGTMLAGAGPAPAAMIVVAADEGWRAQTTEHLAILDSLGVTHGLVVVSRSDLADPATALAESRRRIAATSLCRAEAVAVSAVTCAGLDDLRAALDRLVASMPPAPHTSRVRLFIDRSFTIQGSGTVVTGTLAGGHLAVGDTVEAFPAGRQVRIRALQSLGDPQQRVPAIARVAVNLRGIGKDEIGRGDALLTPGGWIQTRQFDARLMSLDPAELPGDLTLHMGSAAVACTVRRFGSDTCRVSLDAPLPLQLADRGVLRDPSRRLVTGLVVLDVEPPELRRRGAAKLRAAELASLDGSPDLRREVAKRGAVSKSHLAAIGARAADAALPAGVLEVGDLAVDPERWQSWGRQLERLVDADRLTRPLAAGFAPEAARRALDVPDVELIIELVGHSDGRLCLHDGMIVRPGVGPVFPASVTFELDRLAQRLETDPFDAPEAGELAASGLTPSVIAAAARRGLFLRLPGEILVHRDAADRAVVVLGSLPQPFTLSDARQALSTTRRIAVPLLEHLDSTGRTARLDPSHRRVRGTTATPPS